MPRTQHIGKKGSPAIPVNVSFARTQSGVFPLFHAAIHTALQGIGKAASTAAGMNAYADFIPACRARLTWAQVDFQTGA
jgi:hypothetical protein